MNTDLHILIEKAPINSAADRNIIEKAYHFAKKAHEGQTRKSGEPYFNHVFQTACILADLNMNAQIISAGLLHDVVEDTEVTEQELEKEFGSDISTMVKNVTKLGTVKYKGFERNVENLRKFFIAMADDLRVIIIKLADRLHNIQTLEHVREDKQKRIALETLEVYAPLANRLSMGTLKGKLEDGAFKFAYKEEYEKTIELLKGHTEGQTHFLTEIEEQLFQKLKENHIQVISFDNRVKHIYSLWKKLKKYDGDITKVYDLIALRIIVPTIEDCYHVLGIIHGTWKPLPGRIKDYIATPKPNGYQSLHTTIFTGTGGIVEIQIRTEEMHKEAENGLAAHFAYKEGVPKNQYKWINDLRELGTTDGKPEHFMSAIKMDFFHDRIFVFTPKGDIIDLPEGASVIDFAYNVHTDIGNRATGGKVNGKFVALSTKLKNEDVVEIITKNNITPSVKWLDFAKTSIARKHITLASRKESLLDKFLRFGK